MARIVWDKTGERLFEGGIDRGVIYNSFADGGDPWNGLVSVAEQPAGGEIKPYYIDGYLYYNEVTPTDYKATLSAFTYPDAFDKVNGASVEGAITFEDQPNVNEFALTYRTMIGNDLEEYDYGYRIHILYNVIAGPTKLSSDTLTDQPGLTPFSWDIVARPPVGVNFYGRRPTAHFVWDTTKSQDYKTKELEDILYGTSTTKPRMPSLEELMGINTWGDALHIQENYTTGLSKLLYVGSGDLKGDVTKGLYTKHPDSRLVPASTPGFFKLGA